MYNKFMNEKEINVKVGDRVTAHGYNGTVTEVIKGSKTEWDNNRKEYVKIPGTEYTNVRINFDKDSELIRTGYTQYQNGVYGEFYVI